MNKAIRSPWTWYLVFVALFVASTLNMAWTLRGRASGNRRGNGTAEAADVKTIVAVREVREEKPEPVAPVQAPPSPEPERPEKEMAETHESPAPVTPGPANAKTRQGQILHISADYRRNLGFPVYVREMKRLGGVFLVYDSTGGKLKAAVDPSTGEFRSVDMSALRSMSPRMREINGEIAASAVTAKASREFGAGQYSLILLLPRSLDERVMEQVLRKLREENIDELSVARLDGRYCLSGRGLELEIEVMVKSDGTSVPFRLLVSLG